MTVNNSSTSACRFAIDALKATVPIWKRETWVDGESWGLEAQHLMDLAEFEASQAGDRVGSGTGAGQGGRR